ncbi:hypothetical protein ATO9_22990 [Pseudooceanicola atlanticus]|uniref:Uncharacterized protein n=1 Tax=Pseudooceanicola atlanticus TaxID=1461694 RepID=A0A0A0E932_9RHOB|nr:hypothetical protein ATO9_22990 [Pseudooceanicola atlanticus]
MGVIPFLKLWDDAILDLISLTVGVIRVRDRLDGTNAQLGNKVHLDNWLRVLWSDKRAIFKHAADAQRACDYLVAAPEAGQGKLAT